MSLLAHIHIQCSAPPGAAAETSPLEAGANTVTESETPAPSASPEAAAATGPPDVTSCVTRNNLFLAPLAGWGDAAFRILGVRFGAGLTFTEMVSSQGLVRKHRRTYDLLRVSGSERPCGIQLFGADPVVMGEAADLCSREPADLVDINMGCSVRKVTRNGAGAALLDDPEKVYRVVAACVRFSGYPVTVKMRLGPTSDRINIIETGLAARDAGAALLTLHARTASAQFGGSARWEHIGALKSAVDIPVCGNGDIQSPEDAVRMLVDTGCDAVMIGRAAVGNPWLLAGTVRALEQYPEKPAAVHPTRAERIQQALEQLQIAAGLKGERKAIREMLVHLHRYLKGIPGAARVRKELIHAESTDEVRGMLLPLAAKSD